jgi:hypothetical protein
VTFESIVKTLYDLSFPTRSAYKAILSNCNVTRFENYLVTLIRSKTFPVKFVIPKAEQLWRYDSQRAEHVFTEQLQQKLRK